MQSLQAAVSDIAENPQGRHFIKYARRLFIVCLIKGEGEGQEQDFQWKLEPWATSLVTDQEPAARNSFLEYWMTTPNPMPGLWVLFNSCGGLHRDKNLAPIVSLIARLHRLEYLDFYTHNEFTSGLEQAICYSQEKDARSICTIQRRNQS